MEKLRDKTEIHSDTVEVVGDGKKKRNKNISHQTEENQKEK